MPNSPLDASDMPSVLPGQVSPGQPAIRSPLSQEPRKGLEVLRYNLPFVPIMPLTIQVKFVYVPNAGIYTLDFPPGALAVKFTVGNELSISTRGNPADLNGIVTASTYYEDEQTILIKSNSPTEWRYCENIKQISFWSDADNYISAEFYVQL